MAGVPGVQISQCEALALEVSGETASVLDSQWSHRVARTNGVKVMRCLVLEHKTLVLREQVSQCEALALEDKCSVLDDQLSQRMASVTGVHMPMPAALVSGGQMLAKLALMLAR